MANTYLTRSPSSTGNQKTFTLSFWWKNNSPQNADKCFISAGINSSNYFMIRTTGSEELQILTKDNGNTGINYNTNQKFRDANAWYHIVLAFDTTQGSGDRVKYYVNGERVTSFQSSIEPSSNSNILYFNDTTTHNIGRKKVTLDKYFDGTLSHFHFIDGTAYDASPFGETDATTGEWKIKTSPSVNYGTNGYFILKDGNSVTDQSGNGNNFTVGGGTLSNTEDCPDNVFCTLNPFDAYLNYSTLSNGNNTLTGGSQSVNYSMIRGTIGDKSGKYYWEVKAVDNAEIDQVGVMTTDLYVTAHASSGGLQATSWGGRGIQFSNGNKCANNAQSAYMGGFSANDILMVALDLDNSKITFGRNGQWADGSGNANQTYANSTAAYTDLDSTKFYLPAHCQRDSAGNNSGTSQYNFGNGYFGTTAISSEGTNASGIGKFEYDVPSGFTALSTKGLNE